MKYTQHKKAILLLADGTVFKGKSVRIDGTAAKDETETE